MPLNYSLHSHYPQVIISFATKMRSDTGVKCVWALGNALRKANITFFAAPQTPAGMHWDDCFFGQVHLPKV